jgi:cytoskeletal protein RodZ
MHIAILIIAVVIVGAGVFVRNKTSVNQETILGESNPASTETPTTAPSDSPSAPTNTSTSAPTPLSSKAPTPNSSSNLGDFIYPNATVKHQSSSSLSLESHDDADTITDWYKQKIKDLSMNTRSFVQTKTNDNVNNVLAAAKSNEEIKITITKKAGESLVSIVVER